LRRANDDPFAVRRLASAEIVEIAQLLVRKGKKRAVIIATAAALLC
jgi:hypothetical protein